jgi:hypothetical protein
LGAKLVAELREVEEFVLILPEGTEWHCMHSHRAFAGLKLIALVNNVSLKIKIHTRGYLSSSF